MLIKCLFDILVDHIRVKECVRVIAGNAPTEATNTQTFTSIYLEL